MALPDGLIIKERTKLYGYNYRWASPNPWDAPEAEYGLSERVRGAMPLNVNHRRDKDGIYRAGGPWVQYTRSFTVVDSPPITWYRSGSNPCYKGSLTVNNNNMGAAVFTANAPGSDQAALALAINDGAQAMAGLRPDLPDFSSLASLLELRDPISGLKERFRDLWSKIARERRRLRALYRRKNQPLGWFSEHYLAIMFGFIPLASDTMSTLQVFHKRKKEFDRFLADEGKWKVKACRLDRPTPITTSETLVTTSGAHHPNLGPTQVTQAYASNNVHRTYSRDVYESERWAVGSSKFYLPSGPRDAQWRRNIMNRIFGLQGNARAFYNAIPWSWLADYFSGLGHYMDAISEGVADRHIFKYAYVMHHHQGTAYRKYGMALMTTKTTASFCYASCRFDTDMKVRAVASLLGWGLNTEDLSLRQAAILGALGGSKL